MRQVEKGDQCSSFSRYHLVGRIAERESVDVFPKAKGDPRAWVPARESLLKGAL